MKPLITLSVLIVLIVFKADCQKVLWQDYTINKNSYYYATSPTTITTDRGGNVIVSGSFEDSIAFGPYILNTGEFYLVKYNSNGKVQWALSNNSTHNANTKSVVTDSYGNIYLTGAFSDTLKIGSLAICSPGSSPFYGGSFFLAKFDPNGNIQWIRCSSSNYYSDDSHGMSVAVDHSNNIYLAGEFNDTLKVGSFVVSCPGSYTGLFVAKYSASGNPIWVSKARASNVGALFCGTDSMNGIYISGEFTDSVYCGSYGLAAANGSLYGDNIFLIKFDSNGNNKWAKVPGVMLQPNSLMFSSTASAMAMCSDGKGYIYLTGSYTGRYRFGSYTLPANPNYEELFLIKLDLNGGVLWAENASISSNNFSCGTSLSADNWGNIYVGGWAEGDTIGGMVLSQGGFVAKFNTNGHGLCCTNINPVGWYSFNGVSANPFLPVVNIESADQYASDGFKADSINTNGGGYTAEWTCNTCKVALKITGDTEICAGQSTKLSGSGGPSYLWSNGLTDSLITVSPLTTTTYTLFVSDGNCYGDTTFNLVVIPLPNLNISNTQKICLGDSITLSVTGGTHYLWNNGDTTSAISVSPLSNTTYSVSGSNNSCSVVDSVKVLVYQYPIPVISKTTGVCFGASATINVSGGSDYRWNNGDTTAKITVNPLSTTLYSVTVSNGPCSVRDSTVIIVNPLPAPVVCCDSSIYFGQHVQLVSNGGATYSWLPSSGLSCSTCPNPIATPSNTTTYSVVLKSDSGCFATDSVTIIVICRPVNVCCDTSISRGKSVQLNSWGGTYYYWTPQVGLSCDSCSNPIISPTQTTTYTVMINDSGCISRRTVTIDVTCGNLFIPMAFSPNGDGQNDYLYVRDDCIKTMDFMIYDRWGNKLFETTNQSIPWDGNYKGEPMNTGTYVYYLTATMYDGTTVERRGNIALVR